jgi:hypothetical protein
MALYLPYGVWTQVDGRCVWFNRYYEPIIARAADGAVSIPDPAEWVRWVDQRWLYNEATRPAATRRPWRGARPSCWNWEAGGDRRRLFDMTSTKGEPRWR